MPARLLRAALFAASIAAMAFAVPGRDAVAAPRLAADTRQHATAAVATPGEASAPDRLALFLAERGLIPRADESGAGWMDRMRHSASDLVATALQVLGVPYRRGGNSVDEGFDCSGFTRYVFEHTLGRVLPRRADEQARAEGLSPVARPDLQPGDLVFFNTLRRSFSHVGIYLGDGKFIHAPRSGAAVRVEDMRSAYWQRRFNGARRVPVPQASAAPATTGTPPAAAPSAGPAMP